MTADTKLKLLNQLNKNPHFSQRDEFKALGLSLGKTNYMLNALIDKGPNKIQIFKSNQNKRGYTYLFNSAGIKEKIRLTLHFYKVKKWEYEELKRDVELLIAEDKGKVIVCVGGVG